MSFIRDIQVKRGKGRISNCVGVYDIYKMLRKNKWPGIGKPVSQHDFYAIIRTVNDNIANDILSGIDIDLPYFMGRIFIQKSTPKIFIKDGRLVNTFPIDWPSTLKLWEEDREAYNDKILLRYERKTRLMVKYSNFNARFKNQSFYTIDFNRELKREVNRRANKSKLDGSLKYIET